MAALGSLGGFVHPSEPSRPDLQPGCPSPPQAPSSRRFAAGAAWTFLAGGFEAGSRVSLQRQLHPWQQQRAALSLGFAIPFWKAKNSPSVELKALYGSI